MRRFSTVNFLKVFPRDSTLFFSYLHHEIPWFKNISKLTEYKWFMGIYGNLWEFMGIYGGLMGIYGGLMGSNGFYPLVNVYKKLWKDPPL